MIRREDFIDAMGMPDEAFDRAVDAALRQVKESEARPIMKRKMTFALLAAVLAVIALTGAALAVGLNLFGYFGRRDRRLQAVAPEAVIKDASAAEITTDALGVTNARIDSAYYDGQSLIVAYTLDNFRCCERFEPTEAELAEMSETTDFALEADEAPEGRHDAAESGQTAQNRRQPFGMVEYEIGVDDHCTTDDGVTLPIRSEAMEDGEDDLLYCIREFETPLPEAAQDRDSLRILLPVKLYTNWYYFDGEKYYDRHAQEPLAELTATVNRAEGETRSYRWEGELNGARVSAEAWASAVHVKLRIEAGPGAFPEPVVVWPEAASADDTWYSFRLTDSRDMDYRFSGGLEGEASLEMEYDGLGYLPDAIDLTVCLDGEGEWDADAHILPGFPVTLKPE